jgi:L-iditol 2-dehydrogenase
MKALVHTKPLVMEIQDVPEPDVGPEDILVRVQACGVCGSDVEGYTGSTGRRIPPIIMGHEAAGTIAACGDGVTAFGVGDRVAMDSTVYCNRCPECAAGRFNRCERRKVLGVSIPDYRRDGCFAEYVSIPWWIAAPIPGGTSFEQAAMLEPLSIGLHAVARSRIAEEELDSHGRPPRTLVIGAGTIGLSVLLALRSMLSGVEVIMIDPDAGRRELARRMGANAVLDPVAEADSIKDMREGFDAVFEAVGLQATVSQALAMPRKGGRAVMIGNWSKEVRIDLQSLISQEIEVIGTYASAGEFRLGLQLMESGRLDPSPMISGVLPLDEGPGVFRRLHEKEPGLLKVSLRPSD